MKITIDYDSCWRNSFLGGSNNEALPKNGREFLGSMTSLKTEGNFKVCDNTLDTIMGILNRLIGDQRKLYQARSQMYGGYYFENLEKKISFIDEPQLTSEITYIRNMKGSKDQQSFTGMVKASDPIFSSDYSREFWGVLKLNEFDLCKFILRSDFVVKEETVLEPLFVADLIDEIDKVKAVENIDEIKSSTEYLTLKFPELITDKVSTPYVENNGKVKLIRLYSAALYLQLARLGSRFDMSSAISSKGCISGFSKRGYNGRRDFMNRYTTGKPKNIWGNPYFRKSRFNGDDPLQMTKASGQLEIIIDVDREKGLEIKQLIENAGVSSFYLGKKGLAYVSNIRV
ncbi:hypothetical protein K8B83_06770 [Shewanella inventionis]|uniref:type I-Fv CRISPR-associated protein Cas5fv n=1 Tax=Shewanella inventionis TaxID=1738770 RepID=UPI001CC058BE|nr:type I-Fv CRISPR-associated protein Cas5fv [Shewanella inventionis]UAL44527.1 hypothetical protein K8B83_06770 [Shewanella inventionis]